MLEGPSALEVFFINDMRYINPRFTYLLTYLDHLCEGAIFGDISGNAHSQDTQIASSLNPIKHCALAEFLRLIMAKMQ